MVLNNSGELLATVKSERAVKKDNNKAYLQIVIDEATEIISNINNLDKDKAKKELFHGGYTVYTSYDNTVTQQLNASCSENTKDMDAAVVITYKKVGSTVYYSDWSKAKSVKTK